MKNNLTNSVMMMITLLLLIKQRMRESIQYNLLAQLLGIYTQGNQFNLKIGHPLMQMTVFLVQIVFKIFMVSF